MLGKLEPLALVIGDAGVSIERLGDFEHRLIDEAADGLAVLEDEGRLRAPYLQHGARAGAALRGAAEARIEEARVTSGDSDDVMGRPSRAGLPQSRLEECGKPGA